MKIQARLTISVDTLMHTVLPLADGDQIAFLDSLRRWYLLHMSGIHDESRRGDGLKILLNSALDEIPVTKHSIAEVRRQLDRYHSGDWKWTLSSADALIEEICVLRDWNDCCDNDQYDLKYVVDTESREVVKICTACGYTLDLVDNSRTRPTHFQIASRSELVTAGVIDW